MEIAFENRWVVNKYIAKPTDIIEIGTPTEKIQDTPTVDASKDYDEVSDGEIDNILSEEEIEEVPSPIKPPAPQAQTRPRSQTPAIPPKLQKKQPQEPQQPPVRMSIFQALSSW